MTMLRSNAATCVCIAVYLVPQAAVQTYGIEDESPGTQPAAIQPAATRPATSLVTTRPTTLLATTRSTTRPATTRPPSATSQPADPVIDDKTDMIEEDSGSAPLPREVPTLGIVPSTAVGANREPEPPRYVRSIDQHARVLDLQSVDWLDVGIQQRTRFEHRDDFYRAELETGDRILMRTRAYVGIRDVLDPFRLSLEFQDSRRFGSALDDGSVINEADIIQLFGELYFPDVAGTGYPLRLRAGRMSFDSIDRRLVARNRFRNTTNAFDGVRLTLGRPTSDWEIDAFAMMPVDRQPLSFDHNDEEEWLYGLTGYWRGWSPYLNLESYYFMLDRDSKNRDASAADNVDREIHTLGLHGFGLLGRTGFDYDFDVAFQFGDDNGLSHRAFAMHGELGYTFDVPAEPRIAALFNYASGDRDPGDGVSQRFNRLFGASHSMYGYSDLFTWQNIINPAVYVTVRPTRQLRLDAFYRAYWLASSRDAWVVPGLQDASGGSGRFVGQEIDFLLKYQLNRHLAIDVGYAHFMPGSFVSKTVANADDSDFFYVQLALRF